MTTKYTIPSVESILEDSEDESSEELSTKGDAADEKYRKPRPVHDPAMKANTGRERERSRERERERDRPRRHRSSKHTSKGKPKHIEVKRTSELSREGYGESRLRRRHGHGHSNRNSSSTSSSEEDEPEDHRAVLAAARSRLTSPSMVSTFTTQTTATNKSSSSSGSNSTVTQASVKQASIKRSSLGKRPEVEEAGEPPMSPACPDPPNVFQFLDEEMQHEGEDEEKGNDKGKKGQEAGRDEESDESDQSDQEQEQAPQWSPRRIEGNYVDAPPALRPRQNTGASSSASSSFHEDDNGSEPAADVETDRSSSPERSVNGHDEAPEPQPEDPASAKVASQIAAAQHRQNGMQQFGTPNMPRGNVYLPHVPSSTLSSRSQYHMQQRPLPRAEKLPVTGYELLASRLSTRPDVENEGRIKPLYRKFEALNHRLLLHLQDELSELEEQLHRLDHADTQSRRTDHPGYIIPASRRMAAQVGGDLQWHKTDILGKIGYKLNQYNQALSSFNSTQSLHQPDLEDIENYRSYLQTEQPIAEAETHFLDPTDDLVSIYSDHPAPPSFLSSQPPSSTISSSSDVSSEVSSRNSASAAPVPAPSLPASTPQPQPDLQPILPGLASAIAIAILVPILTFSVIPGFVGRLTVAALVACFMVAALVQGGIVSRGALFGRESFMCAGIYGGVMIVLAGTVM